MRRLIMPAVAVFVVMFVAVPASAYYITMSKIGEGTVSPNIGANSYSLFKRCTIRATPAAGWHFDRWEGEMAGKPNPYSWYVTSNKTVSAMFHPNTVTCTTALANYVATYDPSQNMYKIDEDTHLGWTGYEIYLASQSWRTTSDVDRPLWEHDMTMAVPWFSGDDVIMLINGGSNPLKYPSPDSTIALVCIALGVSFAQLDQVPNQPLYFTDEYNNARTEDEILAYSLDKAIDTHDMTWPVHCAMAKAAVKGMDMVQRINKSLDDFMVLGASKRGWATWLTTAVDPRVKWVLPLVIDVFQLPEQVEMHWESYGTYSSAIQDYVDFDLFCRCHNDPWARVDLANIVDPYPMISRFSMPKFVITASGDQFFMPDSSKLYFNQLPGQKWLRVFPNNDHYMEGVLDDYAGLLGILQWGANMMGGSGNPTYSWYVDGYGQIVFTANSTPDSVKLWQATNPNGRDFRLETVGPIYTSSTLYGSNNVYVGYCPPPAQGYTAFFVEATWGVQKFTSGVRINPDTYPFDGMGCY
ncbi:MAG TPA: PhoPQ-activated protein PqaA family protein [Candidatus Bathyarchaeia archaeon]|nr:PhoPQ-activated protein PqaA family protein [Candidatus Bathyarchaeia archaeon]